MKPVTLDTAGGVVRIGEFQRVLHFVVLELVLLQVADPALQRVAVGTEHADEHLVQVGALRVRRGRQRRRRERAVAGPDLVQGVLDGRRRSCPASRASWYRPLPCSAIHLMKFGKLPSLFAPVTAIAWTWMRLLAFEVAAQVGAAAEEGRELVGPVGLVVVADARAGRGPDPCRRRIDRLQQLFRLGVVVVGGTVGEVDDVVLRAADAGALVRGARGPVDEGVRVVLRDASCRPGERVRP